jgi:sensor histidine kinase YesM
MKFYKYSLTLQIKDQQNNSMSEAQGTKKMSNLINTGIWVVLGFFILMMQPLTWGIKIPMVFMIKQFIIFLCLIALYFINAKYVVPKTLLRNKSGLFVIWILAVLGVLLVISELLSDYLHVFEAMVKAFSNAGPNRPRRGKGIDWFGAMSTMLALGISTTVAAFTRWQSDALLRQELEKENVKSELSFLKAQINPHFFFNTLNNIYSLSYIDVPASQDALLKLSRMMRYLLYETQNDTTLLSKEISFVRDYIELMKLRMQESTEIIFKEPARQHDVEISPMILLPYIENAFKHGISASSNNWILIEITFENDNVHMKVQNKIFRNKNTDHNFQERSGIGLQNTARRLNLLYPDKFKLDIDENETDNTYTVNLNLDLK